MLDTLGMPQTKMYYLSTVKAVQSPGKKDEKNRKNSDKMCWCQSFRFIDESSLAKWHVSHITTVLSQTTHETLRLVMEYRGKYSLVRAVDNVNNVWWEKYICIHSDEL